MNIVAGLSLLLLSLVALSSASPCPLGIYNVTNLLSDSESIKALHHDEDFINAWGIASGPTSALWVNTAGTSSSYAINGQGVISLEVEVPGPVPTGIVFNPTTGFRLPLPAGNSTPAIFIFATATGKISGWSPAVNRTAGILTIDNSAHAAYTGLAMATRGSDTFLFGANFRERRIDVWDHNWNRVTSFSAALVDQNLPAGDYSPFNVYGIGGKLYVSYALVDPESGEDLPGIGSGVINVIDLNAGASGQLTRFASGGTLSSPWGIWLAPSSFGAFSGALLVGNFGDGLINAYNATSRAFLGMLHKAEWGPNNTIVDAGPIMIDGLWGLLPGNGGNGGNLGSLYFTAGPGRETHGLLGSITPVTGSSC